MTVFIKILNYGIINDSNNTVFPKSLKSENYDYICIFPYFSLDAVRILILEMGNNRKRIQIREIFFIFIYKKCTRNTEISFFG